ncbi:MAG: hypothetical protein H0W24_05930 [Lysobacter sp.]|nr:hypothetical protein [Lysobacter sp.]
MMDHETLQERAEALRTCLAAPPNVCHARVRVGSRVPLGVELRDVVDEIYKAHET